MGNNLAVLQIMPNKFKSGSVVLITGASQGIGKELALRYASRQCRLLLCARNVELLKNVQSLCNHLGGKAEICQMDVSNEEDCKRMIQECIKHFSKIDILVLNAGVNAHSKFVELPDLSSFKKVMETNFYGCVYPTKYALPYLQKTKGQILVLSSLSGEIGLPFRTAYCSSKFAVTGFFESLRIELENKDIAITIVCPPSVKTNMRDHDLLQKYKTEEMNETDNRMSVEQCADTIILAADKRARKVFFPRQAYLAAYIRPFFPDYVDNKLKKFAKL
ncbi:enoyl-(acyl carrier) reductase (macronuclear) [Tetrahymena thermophila SB210]|uniref:Enoyl-(Acyl carrier) reductase n=1 Tax=Tetrahymena thermophila (strain SB210) TaxID=312017 RepID=I7LV57_TETTS|nr:enoyl-(acyl carrier) reductase [Tetrahymena thermophila SB210]EAR97259.1 enoyl-(acyl carrier) reductase [Tetrahymena thermophila SB210]|eukprot:XP_001017504.1 enoyl-(acyl carrier) reductase [Tetrahymena thermophila SB210]